MTEHKFTDEEIIRALEYWQKFDNEIDDMLRGRFKGDKMLCEQKEIVEITLNIFDLINRQKAEIERLEAHNNKLINNIDNLIYECDCAKQEAFKEFAEKIKTDAEWICDDNYIERALIEYIDNLVKEMTEGKE